MCSGSVLLGQIRVQCDEATINKPGFYDQANNGSVFLDEIGELTPLTQTKLLRVLQEREFKKVGGNETIKINIRVISATNRNLEEEVIAGRFREDLFYRLAVVPIRLPPLRERMEDIPLLVKWFVDQLARKMGKPVTEIPKRTMQMLKSYPWPGNVRELKHAVESALITAEGKKLNFDLPKMPDTELTDFKSFEEMERDYILRILKAKNWRIGGKDSATSALGMHVNTLRGRMKKLGIQRPWLTLRLKIPFSGHP